MGPSRCFSPFEPFRSSAASKNRFLGFFKSSDRNDRQGYERKNHPLAKKKKSLSEGAFFFEKCAFLPIVKKLWKKGENSGFSIAHGK